MFTFRDMSVMMPESAHDAAALRASNLFKNALKLPKVRIKLKNRLTCTLGKHLPAWVKTFMLCRKVPPLTTKIFL